MEALSRIIAELNERFGLNLGPEHRVTLGQMMERLDSDAGLDASARVNTRENVRLTFDQVKLPMDRQRVHPNSVPRLCEAGRFAVRWGRLRSPSPLAAVPCGNGFSC
jgi:hypothetical protein